MASAPEDQPLPILYNELVPLSSAEHADYKLQRREKAAFLTEVNTVPVTIDEFIMIQRHMPIVFSNNEKPVPLALMGLNAGINVFLDDEGGLLDPAVYMPAYIRRYPFLLARLRPDAKELSLCFDPTADVVGEFDDGDPLFENGEASEHTKGLLTFCEEVETSGNRTAAFIEELAEADVLMDGELSVQVQEDSKPVIYRGFRMVDENKLKEIPDDVAKKWVENGILALIYAHLMSLSHVRDIFGKQVQQGKMPANPEEISDSTVL